MEEKQELREERINALEVLYQIDLGFTNYSISGEKSKEIVDYYLANKASIDEIIENSLYKYHLNRLPVLTRCLVRIAYIEMKNGLAPAIAINEALEIAKVYIDDGSGRDVKFINRVLDNISKTL